MQDPNKVKLVDASPDTREKLKIYLSNLRIRKCTLDEKDIKTLEDAILFSIQEAEKVPVLERRIKELEDEIKADNSKMNGGN